MPENPYQPPKEVGTGQAKRWLALSVLAALAVPAASIAGLATCLGATYAEQSLDLFGVRYQTLRIWSCVILGVASSFAVLVAALAPPPERRRAALDAAAGMLGAFLVALALSIASFCIGYGKPATDSLGGNLVFYVGCLTFFLVMSIGGWIGFRYRWGSRAMKKRT